MTTRLNSVGGQGAASGADAAMREMPETMSAE